MVEKELAALKRPGDGCSRPPRGSLGCRGPGTSVPGFGSGPRGTAAARPHGQPEDHGLLGVLAGWGAGSWEGITHPPGPPAGRASAAVRVVLGRPGTFAAAASPPGGAPSASVRPLLRRPRPREPLRPGGGVCPPWAGVQEADTTRLRPSLLCLPEVRSPRVQGSAWCQVVGAACGAVRWMGPWNRLGLPSDGFWGPSGGCCHMW